MIIGARKKKKETHMAAPPAILLLFLLTWSGTELTVALGWAKQKYATDAGGTACIFLFSAAHAGTGPS